MQPTTRKPLVIRTNVKAGGAKFNHNNKPKLVVRTNVKAGGAKFNHSNKVR